MLPDFSGWSKDPASPIQYLFRAGIICSSIGWNLGSKLGLSLHDIHHTTGSVPHYASKLSSSIDRFFARSLPPHKPIQRGSWTLEIGQPLFILPKDEHFVAAHKTQEQFQRLDDIFLRVDWQTMRRLPITGAICLNFKALFTQLEQLREEKGVPALFRKVLQEGDQEILKYKGTWHVEHVVTPALERWAREQVKSGLVEEGWEVGTLKQSPFYEGWESLWRRHQKF